jgi:hypothetical protein
MPRTRAHAMNWLLPRTRTADAGCRLPRALLLTAVAGFTLAACDTADRPAGDAAAALTPQEQFYADLASLCGQAFEGRVVEDSQADSAFAASVLVMHVRECTDSVLRVPFHVGENRSRTWVISRTAGGLRLKHDHRHEDGSEDSVTQYGGDTPDAGTATRQEFAADAHTAALIPAAATNVWSIELLPGSRFTYGLRREGTDRRFFVAFDLTRSVPAPPAPWGAE